MTHYNIQSCIFALWSAEHFRLNKSGSSATLDNPPAESAHSCETEVVWTKTAQIMGVSLVVRRNPNDRVLAMDLKMLSIERLLVSSVVGRLTSSCDF